MLIKLVLESLFPAHSHGAYTLSLLDEEKERVLPILIGTSEAQAINLELEGVTTQRPLTHDLLINFFLEFDVKVDKIIINDFKEGIFHSEIHYSHNGKAKVMDSRTSDAICIAVKTKADIFALDKIMDEVSYNQQGKKGADDEPGRLSIDEIIPDAKSAADFSEYSASQLDTMLQEAINREDYSRAALLRDEISKRK